MPKTVLLRQVEGTPKRPRRLEARAWRHAEVDGLDRPRAGRVGAGAALALAPATRRAVPQVVPEALTAVSPSLKAATGSVTCACAPMSASGLRALICWSVGDHTCRGLRKGRGGLAANERGDDHPSIAAAAFARLAGRAMPTAQASGIAIQDRHSTPATLPWAQAVEEPAVLWGWVDGQGGGRFDADRTCGTRCAPPSSPTSGVVGGSTRSRWARMRARGG